MKEKETTYLLQKLPGAMLYFLAFTAVPAVLYIAYSVLSFCNMLPEQIGTVFTVMGSFWVILQLFYDHVSMLFFGRQYRKTFKGRLSDWPILCYALLTFLNLFFITFISGNEGLYNTYFNFCGFMYAVFIVNIAVPFVVVPLVLSFKAGAIGVLLHLVSSVCMYYVSTLAWIVFGGIVFQSQGESGRDMFNSVPFSLMNCGSAPSDSVFIALFSAFAVCVVTGYLLHGFFIARLENRRLPRVFQPLTCILLVLAFIAYLVLFGRTFLLEHRNATALAALEKAHGQSFDTDNLEKLYLNMQKPDDAFWNKFLDYTKTPDTMPQIDALLDKCGEIPKASRDFAKTSFGSSEDLEAIAAYRVFNCRRLDEALLKKDASSSIRFYHYDVLLDNALLGDIYALAAVQRMSFHDKSMFALLKSGLLDETQLETIYKQCYSRESKAVLLLKRISYWHDYCHVFLTKRRAEECFIEIAHGSFLPFISIRFAKYLFPQLYCSYYQSFNTSLNENDNSALNSLETYIYRQERTSLVAVSGELFRCRRGRYPREISELFPDLLPVLPTDPATGKPLEYSF